MAENMFSRFRQQPEATNPFAQFTRPRRPQQAATQPDDSQRDRTWGEVAKDTGLGIAQGAVNLVGGAASLVEQAQPINQLLRIGAEAGIGPGPSSVASDLTGRVSEAIEDKLSAPLRRKRQELAQTEGFLPSAKKVLTDPALAGQFLAEQVPNLATLGVGSAATAARAGSAALARGATREVAEQAGQKAARRFLTRGGTAMESGFANVQAVNEALAQPDEVWDANPQFQELLARGLSRDAAKRTLASRQGALAAAVSAPLSYLGARVSAPFEAEVFTRAARPGGLRGLASGAGVRRLARGAAAEAAEEAVQEGGSQFAVNVAGRQLDPARGLFEGVPEAAGTGAAIGGLLGGGLAAGGTIFTRRSQPPPSDQGGKPAPAAAPPQVQPAPAAPPAVEAQAPVQQRPPRFPDAPPGSLRAAANAIPDTVVNAAQQAAAAAIEPTPGAAPEIEAAGTPAPQPVQTGGTIEADLPPAVPPWVDLSTGEMRVPTDDEVKAHLRGLIEQQVAAGRGPNIKLTRATSEAWGVPVERLRALRKEVLEDRRWSERTQRTLQRRADEAAAAASSPISAPAAAGAVERTDVGGEELGPAAVGRVGGNGVEPAAGPADADLGRGARGADGEISQPAAVPAAAQSAATPADAAPVTTPDPAEVAQAFEDDPAQALSQLSDGQVLAVARAVGVPLSPRARPEAVEAAVGLLRAGLSDGNPERRQAVLQAIQQVLAGPPVPEPQRNTKSALAASRALRAGPGQVVAVEGQGADLAPGRYRVATIGRRGEVTLTPVAGGEPVALSLAQLRKEISAGVRFSPALDMEEDNETDVGLRGAEAAAPARAGRSAGSEADAGGPPGAGGGPAAAPGAAGAADLSTGAGSADSDAALSEERRRNLAERARIDALPPDERDAEIARLRAENERLRALVDIDPRTGLKNAAAYDRDLPNAGGVAAIDLTLFKGYNTLLTDAGGDQVLAAFGQAMKGVGGDSAYRRGGDEFAFLTSTPEEARALLDELREAVDRIELEIQGADNTVYTVTGVPFAGGVGANEQEAIASRDAAKGKGDRNALPSNVRPVDTGRGSEAGSSPEDRGGAPATEELSAGRERQNPQGGEVTMQNRDRSRLASVQQMQEIRRGPDPDRLGFSRDPNTGAPMVAEGRQVPEADKGIEDVVVMASGRRVPVRYAVVEANELAASHNADGVPNPAYETAPLKALNNGRTAGLQAAWAAGNADAYRAGIERDTALHGVSREAIQAKRQPVLVRLYDPSMNTGDMGAESNLAQQLGLSPVEQAQTDARALPDLSAITWAEDGSIQPAANANFFRAWFQNLGATQAATLQDAQGRPNAEALRRVRAAITWRAYGDERLLTALVEDTNPDNRNVMNALVQAAPAFARLEPDNQVAQAIRDALIGGLDLLRDAAARGLRLDEAIAQRDMFGRNPDADAAAMFMASNIRSPKRMAEAFRAAAEYASRAELQAATLDLLGGAPEPTAAEALAQAGMTETDDARISRDEGAEVRGREGEPGEPASRRAAPGDAQASRVAEDQADLFGRPSRREEVEALRRRRDEERNGRTGAGRTDMMAGPGELFAGPRPEQLDIESGTLPEQDIADYGKARALPASERPADAQANRVEAGRRTSSVQQLDLFVATRGQRRPDQGHPPAVRIDKAKLSRVSKLVRTGQFRSGIERVRSLADAAHILAPLRKSPQERFLILALDADDRPLAVIQHTVGGPAESSVYPGVVLGAVASVPGVASVVFAHNHPSGRLTPSASDTALDWRLVDLFKGSGIAVRGSIIVAPGTRQYVSYGKNSGKGDVTPARRRGEVPIVERAFRRLHRPDEVNPITSPEQAIAHAKRHRAESPAGILLLDGGHRVIGSIPINPKTAATLRTDNLATSHARLMAVATEAAASSVIIYGNERDKKALFNVGSALSAGDLRVLDVIVFDGDEGKSTAYEGTMHLGHTFLSRPDDGDQTSAPGFKRRFGKSTLRIENPVIRNEGDPFIDAADLIRAVGRAKATEIILRNADSVENTGNWVEVIPEKYGEEFPTVRDFLKKYPDGLKELYLDAYRVFDDPDAVAAFKEAGFDGAIYLGNGETAGEVEYKVFDEDQVKVVGEVGGAGRPTTNSNGQPIHRTKEGVRNFWRWFGNSKVVDEQGRPLVVYHGSPAQFDVFDPRRMNSNGSGEGYGFYFSDDADTARGYQREGGQLVEAYLSLQKPLPVKAKGFTKSQIHKIIDVAARAEMAEFPDEVTDLRDTFVSNAADTYSMPWSKAVGEMAAMIADNETAVDQIAELANIAGNKAIVLDAVRKVTGYDGIEADGYGGGGQGGGRIFLAWFPEQIKSATGNRGTFDPKDPNILFSFAGQQAETADRLSLETAQERINAGANLRPAVESALGSVAEKVKYVPNYKSLPDRLRQGVESRIAARGGRGQTAALFDPATGDVYLFTDVVKDPKRAVWHAAHEIAGHQGLRALLGDKLDRALEIALQNPTVEAVAKAIAKERGLGMRSRSGRLLAAEEALAELAAAVRTGNWSEIESRYGAPVPEGIRERVAAAVENFLRRLKALMDDLFGEMRFTDGDVRSLLENAWQAAQGEPSASVQMPDGSTISEQVVFHGTPHTVDRFSLQRIGTGEGAQSFGWGLYFASKREVAEWYRKKLTRRNEVDLWTDELRAQLPQPLTLAELDELGALGRKMLSGLSQQEMARWRELKDREDAYNAAVERLRPKGQLYAVEIPEDSDLLDWDKPLSEQSEKVRDALKKADRLVFGKDRESIADWVRVIGDIPPHLKSMTGNGIYAEIAQQVGGARAASEYLNELGIPGLRYLDGGSRGAGKGSHNYVIWDEAAIGDPEVLESTRGESAESVASSRAPMKSRAIDQTETPEFKRWFGNSKVVDEQGRPLVVYHGTRRNFDTFVPMSAPGWGTGIYFTDNRAQAADQFGGGEGGRVVEAYVSIKNPWRGGYPGDAAIEGTQAWREASATYEDPLDAWDEDGEFAGQVLRELGYDGVIARDSNDINGLEIVAFRPEQIKIVADNRGTFDPDNPSILESVETAEPDVREQAVDQTQTPAFRRWFGDSKVVDENGDPLVVYHGTTADFDTFMRSKLGSATGARSTELGFYFTDNPFVANVFAGKRDGGNVMPVYLSLQNPLTIGHLSTEDRKRGFEPFEVLRNAITKISGKESWEDVTAEDVVAWRERVEGQGYDGIILLYTAMDSMGGGTARSIKNPYHHFYIAFRPEQIKSATGNRGTFDPKDPNILFSFAGQQAETADRLSRAPRGGASRTAWGKFPPAAVAYPFATGQAKVRDHADYQAAKSGDLAAAERLVRAFVTPDAVARIQAMIGGRRPVLVPVLAEEASGRNKIPLAFAMVLGEAMGLPVSTGIVQSVRANHTGASAFHRLAFQPAFDGRVEPGDYLIVDDAVTLGGTLANLRGHIETSGGRVIGAAVLTGSGDGAKMALDPATEKSLRETFGDALEQYLQEEFGFGIAQLTEGEAAHIRKARTLDEVRNRVAQARRAAGVGLAEGILRAQSAASRVPESRPQGLTAERARASLAELTARWGDNAPEVRLATTPAEWARALRSAGLEPSPGLMRAEGLYDGRPVVWLNLQAIRNEKRLAQVLAHEALGHYGVENVVGAEQWRQIVDSIDRLRVSGRGSENIRQVLAEVSRRYVNIPGGLDLSTAEGKTVFAKEAIAVMAERGIRTSAVMRVVAAVRRWLRRFMPGLGWSESDILGLLGQADSFLRAGRAGESAAAGAAAASRRSPVFYSALLESVTRAAGAPKKGGAAAWKSWLDGAQRRGEFRQSERDWLGVDEWLASRDTTTREELADYIRANQVQVEEVVLGTPAAADRNARQRDIMGRLEREFGITAADDGVGGVDWITVADDFPVETWPDAAAALRDEWMALHAEEVVQGGPAKYESFQLPGGENYRELLLTLPAKDGDPLADKTREELGQLYEAEIGYNPIEDDPSISTEQLREYVRSLAPAAIAAGTSVGTDISGGRYQSSHWDQPDVLAHVRFNERTDADGKRVLFIEEIQSDWAQGIRRHGVARLYTPEEVAREVYGREYADLDAVDRAAVDAEVFGRNEGTGGAAPTTSGAKLPDMPFKGTDEWAMLSFKRMARWAVDNGFDRIAWTTGDQQAERYDLSKQVDRIEYERNPSDGTFDVTVYGLDGRGAIWSRKRATAEEVADTVGKEIADKMGADSGDRVGGIGSDRKVLRGDGLKVGGEGMRAFYDKILPSAVNKWAKKFGATVGKTEIVPSSMLPHNTKRQPVSVHSIDVTDAMRDAVLAGQPLFSRQPPAELLADIEVAMGADIGRSMQARAKAWLEALRPENLKENLRGVWLGALGTNHLTELGQDYLPGMRHYSDILKEMEEDRNTLMQEGEQIAERVRSWAGKNRAMARRLFDLMHEATIDGVDPSKAYEPLRFRYGGKILDATDKNVREAIKAIRQQMRERSGDTKQDMLNRIKALTAMARAEKRRRGQYGGLVAKWNELSQEAQEHFIALRDAYASRSEAIEEALAQRIEDLKSDGVPDGHRRAMVAKIREQFETARLQGIYFPLQRFGQFFVAAEKDDTTTFLRFESIQAADKAEKELKARGWRVTAKGKLAEAKAEQAPPGTFVAEVIAELRKANISEKTQDSIYQLYLNALPELSMRKHQIHRKAIPGFDPDALRAFGWNMLHGSHQLAKLRHMHKLEGVLKLMDKQRDEMARDPNVGARKAAAAAAILEELNRRHQWIANPTDSKLTALASSIGFTYYLGLTPAAALVNLTQVPIVAYPVLGAKFGAAKAANALLKASAEAFRTVGNIDRVLGTDEERRAFQAIRASGVLERTQAHNLAGIAEGGLSSYNPAWAKAMEVIGFGFHKAEVINRESVAMAAFRLARESGMSFDEAVRYARDAVVETQFDYSNANRARFMQSGAAKVLLMFRQYSLNMTWFLARNLWLSTKGMDPQVRREARKKLTGVLGMTALFSGVLGLPLMSVLFGVLESAAATFGDDDEPFDAEAEFRNFLADMFGPQMANVLATGPVNAMTGADIASRVSLSQLWFRDADRELEGRGMFYHLLEQAAGPMGGILKNALVGKQQIDEGHLWRGVETMLPKALKDGMKSARYAVEGVNTLRGDPLVQDLSLWQTLLQLSGFTPDQVARQYDANRAIKGYEQAILDRRQHLIGAYYLAYRMGDADGLAAARAKIAAFNAKHPEIAITSKTLRRSMIARMRYSQRAESGIVVNPRLEAKARASARFAEGG